jgi:ABC-type glycerol-3-phosphate transport system permease component
VLRNSTSFEGGPIPGLLQFKGIYSAEWQLLMAGSTILVVPPVLVFLLGQKYFIEGITRNEAIGAEYRWMHRI